MNYNNLYKKLLRKRFGQIFLKDINVIKSIISLINPEINQTVVEIGPGTGALTKNLVNLVKHLFLIEIDIDLATKLINTFNSNNIHIICQDVINTDFFILSRKVNQKLRLIGNLPYNNCISIIFHTLKYINIIHDIHFMLQKELANRITAVPNNKKYGKLSVVMQYYYNMFPVITVSPSSFYPIPKVYSTMIKFVPRYHKVNINLDKLLLILNLAFSQRRKKISNSLKNIFSKKDLIKYNINPVLRADEITTNQYYYLTNQISI
ncbi:MAG: 16S rRNA (adenine(1518)-N(6)/adenine(1519)-N(6))-dimethyltransferase RsmA [Candidatus Lightella neohaematopini]|nr:16S rRNA (adenine(1518)-N(6)/adenine(1519)-N(6))-dimethyltransferase RsmA [Candidatus Lightella neohaematopini]MCV2528751.1 16S rRNA (adenine(1518)-N(6)/adenine(1519)-N(6))-dimethyltransferase RsmA [Candidatus Lightella neohaematopini]